MMIYIEPYKTEKKVNDYLMELNAGSRVLIVFNHGLGDTANFYPVVMELRKMYPQIVIDLWVGCEQNTVWNSVDNWQDESYDLIFGISYPFVEGSGINKAENCCIKEMGIPCPIESKIVPDYLPQYPNPIVAVHLHCTSSPQVGASYETSRLIWNEILDAGLVPLEIRFEHYFHNPVNKQFDFITSSTKGCKQSIHSLIGIIRNSFAFIGVESGPVNIARSCIPGRTLFLENGYTQQHFSLNPIIKEISIKNYIKGSVYNFLMRLIEQSGYRDWRI